MQNLVDLLYREEEREMLPLCAAEGIGVIPWSPQARGRLTRDWGIASTRSETDEALTMLFAKTEEADREVVDRRGRHGAGNFARPGGAGLAVVEVRYCCPNRGCNEAVAA